MSDQTTEHIPAGLRLPGATGNASPMTGSSTTTRPAAPVAAAPSARQADPLVARGEKFLTIDPARDKVSSSMRQCVNTIDADLLLTEGIALAGTHYGINVISTDGVVVLLQGARILPSRTRPSSVIAKKIVIVGEAVIERVQADTLLALADGSQSVFGSVAFGESFVSTDTAQWRVVQGVRQLAARERRAEHHHREALEAAVPEENGFQAFCKRQDTAMEEQNGVADQPAQRPHLTAVAGASVAHG